MRRKAESVRALAHHLWQRAGSPHGYADEFWRLAELRLKSHTPARIFDVKEKGMTPQQQAYIAGREAWGGSFDVFVNVRFTISQGATSIVMIERDDPNNWYMYVLGSESTSSDQIFEMAKHCAKKLVNKSKKFPGEPYARSRQ